MRRWPAEGHTNWMLVFVFMLVSHCRLAFGTSTADEPYLWTFHETEDGRTEPQKMRLQDASRPWFQQLMRAEVQLSRGRLGEAETYYRTILKRFAIPAAEEMAVHVNLGHILTNFTFYDEALVSYTHAASAIANPQDQSWSHVPPFAASLVLTKQGRLGEASASLGRALFFRPTFLPALYNLGALHFITGDSESAVHFWEAVVSHVRQSLEVPHLDIGPLPRNAPQDTLPWLQQQLLQAFYQEAPTIPHPRPSPSDGLSPMPHIPWAGNEDPVAFARHLERLLRFFDRLSDERFALHMNLGLALQNIGAADAADAHLLEALQRRPAESWIAWHRFLTLPLVPLSSQAGIDARNRLAVRARNALAQGWAPPQPDRLRDTYFALVPLTREHRPARELLTDLSHLIARSVAAGESGSPAYVDWEAPSHAVPRWERPRMQDGTGKPDQVPRLSHVSPHDAVEESGGNTIRVGIVSYQLFDGSVGHLLRRLVRHLREYGRARNDLLEHHYPQLHGDWRHNAPFLCSDATLRKTSSLQSDIGRAWTWLLMLRDSLLSTAGPPRGSKTSIEVRLLQDRLRRGPSLHPAECMRRSASVGGGTGHDRPGWSWTPGAGSGTSSGPSERQNLWHRPQLFLPGVGQFHVSVGLLRPFGDAVTRQVLADADSVVRLDHTVVERRRNGTRSFRDVAFARNRIRAMDVDVLIVADTGLDAFVWSLLQSRLAPVQIGLLGGGFGPIATLGVPDSLDFVVSGDAVASPWLDKRTAEQTVRLGSVGTFLPRFPAVPESEFLATVQQLSLLASRRYYFVPRPLAGIDPSFDLVLGRILRDDLAAEVLLLYEGEQELWRALFRRRLASHPDIGPSLVTRVRFVRHMPRKSLWSVMLASSVIVDPFPTGLGMVGLEALSLGVPVVTQPELQPERRLVYGALRQMGVEGLIVSGRDPAMLANAAMAVATGGNASHGEKEEKPEDSWSQLPTRLSLSRRVSSIRWDDSWLAGRQQQTPETEQHEEDGLAWKKRLDSLGYLDPASDTLNDWMTFIGRVGRPWAAARQRV